MKLTKTICRRMKIIREVCALTQAEVAEKMGVAQSYYNALENGHKTEGLNIKNIEKYCNAVKVNPAWLLGGTAPPFTDTGYNEVLGPIINRRL